MRLQKEYLVRMLKDLRDRGATELHLKTNTTPAVRRNGVLERLDGRPLTHNDTQAAAFALCGLAGQKAPTLEDMELDFVLEGTGRFRAFLFRQQGTVTSVIHVVHDAIPTLAELDVALSLPKLMAESGLWLICGRQRELLLASLVQAQSRGHAGHTVVIEEDAGLPYRDALGMVSVRRLGRDAPDLASAVRTSRRMGADLLVTGDVRDARAAQEILEAAESGLPTIATLGFTRAPDLLPGFARLFEAERRDEVVHRLQIIVRETFAYPTHAVEVARAQRTHEDPPPLPRALLER